MERCKWCLESPEYMRYHDNEWGRPSHDDRELFEFLVLECMQCGLSWSLILKKREAIRTALAGFDYDKLSTFTREDVEKSMTVEGMIKSPQKIKAMVENARAYKNIIAEHGSFDKYLWAYTDGKTLCYKSRLLGVPVAQNRLSQRFSRDMKKAGFKYFGPVVAYSYLQAAGLINDHVENCFCRRQIIENYPIEFVDE